MKRLTFLSAVIAMVLVVTAVGCTPFREVVEEDDYYYYDRAQAPSRIYVDDPYRGTVVLERDPYTGRYYELNSYGYYASPYGYRSNRYNNYGRYYNNRSRTYSRNTRPNSNETARQSEEQTKNQEQRAKDRRRILGGK